MKRLIFFLCLLLPALPQHAQGINEAELRKFFVAAQNIYGLYVDTVNAHKLVEDAIRGMLEHLDPHSNYSDAQETKKLNEPLQGSFDGIGVQFNMLEDTVLVIQPITKGPSERVGILAGDRIISCNDTTLAGVKMSRDEIMRHLRGPRGSIAHLGIRREGIKELLYFDVQRDKIPVNSVDAAFMITPKIGLIRFNNFAQTTHREILEALVNLKMQGMESLIIDLTQNGGGYLGAAAEIASEFLPEGDMIVYTEGRSAAPREFRSRGGHAFQEGRVAVLVDEYSASAAEILSGALQDQDRGIVVGRRTFGKGLVQWPIDLPDGSMIRLTVSRYYTPSGRCIQKPYEKGKQKEYHMDVINRYNNGELTNADSIHFPDSLKYKTLRKGRTVYGGGGVMPDIFVPLDTTRYTKTYRQLSAKSLIINHNLRYLDKNRKTLQQRYPDFETFRKNFEVPQPLIDGIYAEADKQKIERPKEEREATDERLRQTLKALIARDLWDMNEYFAIVYEDDPIVTMAVKKLSEPDRP